MLLKTESIKQINKQIEIDLFTPIGALHKTILAFSLHYNGKKKKVAFRLYTYIESKERVVVRKFRPINIDSREDCDEKQFIKSLHIYKFSTVFLLTSKFLKNSHPYCIMFSGNNSNTDDVLSHGFVSTNLNKLMNKGL